MGTVFIAIDKCDVDNGCLKVLVARLFVMYCTIPVSMSHFGG